MKDYPGWIREYSTCPMCSAEREILVLDPDYEPPQEAGGFMVEYERFIVRLGTLTPLRIFVTFCCCQHCGYVWMREHRREEA